MTSGVIDVVMAGIGPPGPVSGAAGGDLAGAFPNPTIKNDAVTTAKIANAAVTLEKLAFDVTTQVELDSVVSALNAALAEKATSAELQAAVTALVDAAPGVLDTLNELAAALGDDPNFATTVMAALALKADSDHDHNGTYVEMIALAGNPALLIAGAITRDANDAATSAPVVWPDGTPGTYTATSVSTAFPGAVDAYTITYGSPVTLTYTQPAVTRNANGAVTTRPAITVA